GRIVTAVAQNLLGPFFAVSGNHGLVVFRHAAVATVDAAVDTIVTVAVPIGAYAGIFEEFVIRHEWRQDFHRHRCWLVARCFRPYLGRRAGGGFVRDHRVHGVVEVFHEHFPIAFVDIFQAAAGHLEFTPRRAIDHVVDG